MMPHIALSTRSCLADPLLWFCSILILASAVFYYGSSSAQQSGGPASLFDAYDLIYSFVGKGMLLVCIPTRRPLNGYIIGAGAATLFAIGLLASGQVRSGSSPHET